jgi:hypothetical protein
MCTVGVSGGKAAGGTDAVGHQRARTGPDVSGGYDRRRHQHSACPICGSRRGLAERECSGVIWNDTARPQAVYTDKAGMFQPTLARGWKTDDPDASPRRRSEERCARWGSSGSRPILRRPRGRAWSAVSEPYNIGLVKALPQSQGRDSGASQHLSGEGLPPLWNQRFARLPASPVEGHRPLEKLDLSSILNMVEERGVANDYTAPWRGVKWQIPAHGDSKSLSDSVGVGLRQQGI